jgi:anhydro-N-acetylmuramic acid kinase
MSGTSADAIDAVLIECRGATFTRVVHTYSQPYPPELRAHLLALAGTQHATVSLESFCQLDADVADCFATAALHLVAEAGLERTRIEALGSHGQTLFHRGGAHPLTLQIGDPGRVAERTGIDTVGDFRRRDVALGGQGAPLVPAFHHAVFATAEEARAVLNLGGIANLTLLPDASPEHVRGFDTGPANALLDEWSLHCHGNAFDADGRLAASGTVDAPLLQALLDEPYFAAPPPKSTGRGDFHLDWARRRYPRLDELPAADVQATFAELTAASVAAALRREQPSTRRLIVCGGGARNRDLLARLARRLEPTVVIESAAAFGLDPQAVEGAAFGWLAMRAIDRLPGNLPAVTGAARATVLGALYRH